MVDNFWDIRRWSKRPTPGQVAAVHKLYQKEKVVAEPGRVSDHIGCPFGMQVELKVEQVEGEELTLHEYQVRVAKFGPAAHVKVTRTGGEIVCVRTMSTIVIEQLAELEGKLPLLGRFYAVENYHILK